MISFHKQISDDTLDTFCKWFPATHILESGDASKYKKDSEKFPVGSKISTSFVILWNIWNMIVLTFWINSEYLKIFDDICTYLIVFGRWGNQIPIGCYPSAVRGQPRKVSEEQLIIFESYLYLYLYSCSCLYVYHFFIVLYLVCLLCVSPLRECGVFGPLGANFVPLSQRVLLPHQPHLSSFKFSVCICITIIFVFV